MQRKLSADSPSRTDGSENLVGLRELSGGEFRMDFLTIDDHLKGPSAGGHEFERTNPLLEPQQFLRQTDGMWLIVSSRAIFNDDFQTHNALFLFPHTLHSSLTLSTIHWSLVTGH